MIRPAAHFDGRLLNVPAHYKRLTVLVIVIGIAAAAVAIYHSIRARSLLQVSFVRFDRSPIREYPSVLLAVTNVGTFTIKRAHVWLVDPDGAPRHSPYHNPMEYLPIPDPPINYLRPGHGEHLYLPFPVVSNRWRAHIRTHPLSAPQFSRDCRSLRQVIGLIGSMLSLPSQWSQPGPALCRET